MRDSPWVTSVKKNTKWGYVLFTNDLLKGNLGKSSSCVERRDGLTGACVVSGAFIAVDDVTQT